MGFREQWKNAAFAYGITKNLPFSCLFQVTNRCNMRCEICGFWRDPASPAEELNLTDIARMAEELAEIGCFLISLEGGEPLLRPDLEDIIRILSNRHSVILYTNGWHIDPLRAKALFANGLLHAGVSIDYPDPSRHDAQRGCPGAFEQAWKAVDAFRQAAPRGHRQVHVMTVLMEDNWRDAEHLLQQSAESGVGHQFTLLSSGGSRRDSKSAHLPPPEAASYLVQLWKRHGHLRFFKEYFQGMSSFLQDAPLPECLAGRRGFNIDHRGNISACIERIDQPVGNLRQESLPILFARLAQDREARMGCQACWTACRGLQQFAGRRGSLRTWWTLATRMRA